MRRAADGNGGALAPLRRRRATTAQGQKTHRVMGGQRSGLGLMTSLALARAPWRAFPAR
jgi:hypothetical protein